MAETPVRVEVCCDPSCENHNVQQIIPLTAEEIAQMELDAQAMAEARAAQEAADAARAELKASAKAKLIAGQPLTAEEADVLVL